MYRYTYTFSKVAKKSRKRQYNSTTVSSLRQQETSRREKGGARKLQMKQRKFDLIQANQEKPLCHTSRWPP